MLRNYLAAALRNLARNKLHALINIAGLAIGLAAALIVVLYLRNELTFEHFLPGYERIFRVHAEYGGAGSSLKSTDTTPTDIARILETSLPSLQPVVRLDVGEEHGVRVGSIESLEQLYWADPGFFDLFAFPAVAGDLSRALHRPDGVVLTRSLARRFFGRDDPIGQTLEIDRKHSLQVAAVIEDLPATTHFGFNLVASALAPYSTLAGLDSQPPGGGKSWSAYTYFRLPEGGSLEPIRQVLADFVAQGRRRAGMNPQIQLVLPIEPIAAIHFLPPGQAAMKVRGSLSLVYAIAVAGTLILLIAAINFVNLSTARAARRAVEVGVRKALGGSRWNLIVQFMTEALLYAGFAAVLSIALVELALPVFNRLAGTALVFDYFNEPLLLLVLVGLVLLLGCLAGAYPALVLSSFRPVMALRGGKLQPAGGSLRLGLVTLQFAVLIGLLIAVVIIAQQTAFAKKIVARLNATDVIGVGYGCTSRMADLIGAVPGVLLAACSSSAPLGFEHRGAFATVRPGVSLFFMVETVDFGFFELYGIRPVAGRVFARARGADAVSTQAREGEAEPVVLNETAVRKFGFPSALAAVGQTITLFDQGPSQVIGVVPDFPIGSIRDAIDATVFHIAPKNFRVLSIRLTGQHEGEALAAIDALLKELDPSRPSQRFPIAQALQGLYADIVSDGFVFSGCAVLALLLAALGIFGLSSYATERRTREVGIRKAMGASRFDILRLLLWQLTQPVLWANVIAWPIGYFVMHHWLHGFAYHVNLGLEVFFLAGAAALLIAWVTVLWHTVRIVRSKPVMALRYE